MEYGLNTNAGRLATFDAVRAKPGRRSSTTKRKPVPPLKWPHQTPTPEELARAGFYFNPSATSPDSVSCFLCNKALDGWAPQDNPASEHLSHVPDCGWAINACIEQAIQRGEAVEEDPMSARMVESRRATFREDWPHEDKKGWKCKVQKMVEAGWCFAPVPEADDCVACCYCGISLDGWEPKDNPWHEHQRRSPQCPFFTFENETKPNTGKAATGKKAKSSRISKSARLSTQSNTTTVSENPSMSFVNDLIAEHQDPAVDDSVVSTQSAATIKAGRSRQSTKVKLPPRTTRRITRDRKGTVGEDSMLPNEDVAEMEEDMVKADVEHSAATVLTESPKIEEQPRGRAKARGSSTRGTRKRADSSVKHAASPPPRAVRGKAKTEQREVASQPTSCDSLVEETEQRRFAMSDRDEGLPEPASAAEATPRSTRGTKRMSDGTTKQTILSPRAEPSIAEAAEEDQEHQPRTKKGRNSKKPSLLKKPKRTASRAASRAVPEVEAHELDEDQVPYAEPPREDNTADADIPPTPPPHASSTLMAVEPPRAALTAGPHDHDGAAVDMPSPSASAQSSDAENQPPSSRPSLAASSHPLIHHSPSRPPLSTYTPTTSPSKRNIIAGNLVSAHPWQAVDLDTAFLWSPTSRHALGKENASTADLLVGLSSPEKKMTVEQWIMWNAKRAEDNLKNECERMIGVFESEGLKAIRTMEGIECAF